MTKLMVVCAAVLAAAAYIIYRMASDNYGTERLDAHRTFWNGRMKAKGLTLNEVPGNGDDSLCDVKWLLTSDTVRIEKSGWGMWKLIRAVDKGTVTIQQLEAMSKWPVTRLP